MKSLDNIAEDLFNKIRGRFPSVTIGDADGKITNDPITARFFDFDYKEGDRNIGKVSISISEDKLAVMYSNSFVENEDTLTRQNWYNFLKELRTFAKKRLLQFDTRDITKSNLNKRDYEFLAKQGGDTTMSESKLYGTSRVSYQDVGNARLNIRHTRAVNPELAASRTQHIEKIYIESSEGEKFIYPYKHLGGARAMARHVAEGGKPYDEFGKHITGLSEEVAKLRKFKTYMGRSAVMAESLAGYLDAVVERIDSIKTELNHIQRPTTYKETFDNFEVAVMEDVPEDVAENWIDQLTIRQFNEDLKDIFPYVYRLVSEHTKAKAVSHQDLIDEDEELEENPILKLIKKGASKLKKNPIDDPTMALATTAAGAGTGGALAYYLTKDHKYANTKLGKALRDAAEEGDEDAARYYEGLPDYTGFDEGRRIIEYLAKVYNVDGDPLSKVDESNTPSDEFGNWADEIEDTIGAEPSAEPKQPEVPMTEFVLSLFDRETGEWPKGETAVLTAIEKDYGEQYITPAKEFIERIKETYDNYQMEANPQQMEVEVEEDFDPKHFDSEFGYEAVGDDGESTECTVSYTATIIDGKPVVHPKSIRLDCPMDGNSKLGYDADMDLEMQDMNDIMQTAQIDANEQWADRNGKDKEKDYGSSFINGVNMDGKKRWKQTSLLPMDAIKKYGKQNVRVGKLKMRDGSTSVEIKEEVFVGDHDNEEFDRMRELAGL